MTSESRLTKILRLLIVGSYLGLIMVTAISVRGNDKDRQPGATPTTAPDEKLSPVMLWGKGHQKSIPFTLEPGLSIFDISHDGENNLIVHLLDDTGRKASSLFNEIGPYQGRRGFAIARAGQYALDVDADGEWTVNIEQPRPKQAPSAPLTLSGKGNSVSGFVQLDKGPHDFVLNSTGQGRFRVLLHDQSGQRVESIASEDSPFTGTKPARVPRSGLYFLNVTSDGAWTADVK